MDLNVLISAHAEGQRHHGDRSNGLQPRHRADVLPGEGEDSRPYWFVPRHRAEEYRT